MLIVFIYCLGVVGFFAVLFAEPYSWYERAGMLPFVLLIPAGCVLLAKALWDFECWSWFFMMLALGGVVWTIAVIPSDTPYAVEVVGVLIPVALWIHYFWSRRWQFWADSPTGPSRRRPERWVTPEWRAARLARMGEGSGGSSPACPSRAETAGRNSS